MPTEMKTTFLLIFLSLSISQTLEGQVYKFKIQDNEMKGDSSVSNDLPFQNQIDTTFKLDNNFDLGTLQKNIGSELKSDNLLREFPDIQRYRDYAGAEEYPGSFRFYSVIPRLNISPYTKSFIREPDKSKKYYLIIKDPVRHTITR